MENNYIDLGTSQSILKELARLQLQISNYAFDAQIIWCRVAVNKFEVWNKAAHHHSFYELHLCCSGYAVFEDTDKNTVTVSSGEFVLFPPSTSHKLIDYSDDFSKLVFGFSLNLKESDEYRFLSDSFNEIKVKNFKASSKMLTIPSEILEEIKLHRKGFKFAICELLSLLIIESARVINPSKKEDFLKYSSKDTKLDSIILYMRNNLHTNLTADDIATVANMSSKQLNRIMFENYNMSISTFFKKEKIKKAKELLENSDYSISQIASLIGFSDEFSFSKSFKKIEGITPASYRSSYFQK